MINCLERPSVRYQLIRNAHHENHLTIIVMEMSSPRYFRFQHQMNGLRLFDSLFSASGFSEKRVQL